MSVEINSSPNKNPYGIYRRHPTCDLLPTCHPYGILSTLTDMSFSTDMPSPSATLGAGSTGRRNSQFIS
ncbi:MAG: hypothetical protein LBK18_06295 [Prevotellaceae bacterium]|nr:hypothetical protein [Prevotellaceae bacterium]